MDIRKRKRFLYIGNIAISVLAVTAILGCLLLPLWNFEISVSFSRELGDALKDIPITPETDSGAARSVSYGTVGNTDASYDLNYLTDQANEIYHALIDAVCEADLRISLSGSVTSAEILGALYDRDKNRAADLIDKAVDDLISDVETTVEDVLGAVSQTAAKELVKIGVNDMLKENEFAEDYDKLMSDIGEEKKERIESIVDDTLNAVTAEDATVASVTDKLLSSADEIHDILAGIEAYKERADTYTEEARQTIREKAVDFLIQFADEDGNLIFRDKLIQMALDYTSGQLDEIQLGQNEREYFFKTSSVEFEESGLTTKELIAKLKEQLKTMVLNTGDGALAKFVVNVMALGGALLLVILFMLFYPILRTFTNIGAKNPGFVLAVPIIGGILPFLFLVILPSIALPVIRSAVAKGGLSELPPVAAAILNSLSVRFSSAGTVAAFIFGIALFIFSFFYGRQRRALKKELKTAAKAQEQTAPPISTYIDPVTGYELVAENEVTAKSGYDIDQQI